MQQNPYVKASFLALAYLSLADCREYSPIVACSNLTAPDIEGAKVAKFRAEESYSGGIYVCNVNTHLTHEKGGDDVRVQTYLPLHGYTGRFQGLGGAAMIAGYFDDYLADSAKAGFVTGSTDAGRWNATETDDTWAGDDQLMINFAYLSVHELALVGKALAKQFYGQPVEHAYWNGCSNGGRQGYEAAQRYPYDFDGIMANSPGINWDRFLVADLFPYLVEVSEDEFPPPCVWDAIAAAAIDACDELDGSKDNVINLPFECNFNATSTVGQEVCNTTITKVHARMWDDITRGPQDASGKSLWGGLLPGTNFTSLAGSEPFSISRAWTAAFVERNRTFSIGSIPRDELSAEMAKSEKMYRSKIGGDNPDLSGFRDAGGKLITFHGLIDQILPVNGTVDYRHRVEDLLGGNKAVNEFYRLFLAPGVDHCQFNGTGAQPSDPFSQLIDWVEKGVAPDVMPATGPSGDRNLCPFPKSLIYSGEGDLKKASSWKCVQVLPINTPNWPRALG
ncbi:feruloyl esterase B [Hypoxylon sp. FL1284]|nr:feruloyl esterase B [Hypoxylon sp. FL1284]